MTFTSLPEAIFPLDFIHRNEVKSWWTAAVCFASRIRSFPVAPIVGISVQRLPSAGAAGDLEQLVLDEPVDTLPCSIADHFAVEHERFSGQCRFIPLQMFIATDHRDRLLNGKPIAPIPSMTKNVVCNPQVCLPRSIPVWALKCGESK